MRRSSTLPMIRRAGAVSAVVAAGLLLAGAPIVLAGAPIVFIEASRGQYVFVPSDVTVLVGYGVTWSNNSEVPHTVTSDASGGPLDSPVLGPNGGYRATFDTAGTFAYHCEVHPEMRGNVHVEAVPKTDAEVAGSESTGAGNLGALALAAAAGFGGWVVMTSRRQRLRRAVEGGG